MIFVVVAVAWGMLGIVMLTIMLPRTNYYAATEIGLALTRCGIKTSMRARAGVVRCMPNLQAVRWGEAEEETETAQDRPPF